MMLRKLVKVTDAENKEVFFSIFFKDLKKKEQLAPLQAILKNKMY